MVFLRIEHTPNPAVVEVGNGPQEVGPFETPEAARAEIVKLLPLLVSKGYDPSSEHHGVVVGLAEMLKEGESFVYLSHRGERAAYLMFDIVELHPAAALSDIVNKKEIAHAR